jgi:hypothetical protein
MVNNHSILTTGLLMLGMWLAVPLETSQPMVLALNSKLSLLSKREWMVLPTTKRVVPFVFNRLLLLMISSWKTLRWQSTKPSTL